MNDFQTKLSQAEQQVAGQLKHLTTLRGTLQRVLKDSANGKRPLPTLRKLLSELKTTPCLEPAFSPSDLATLVEQQIDAMAGVHERSLLADLRIAAEPAGLTFGRNGDDLMLGPFLLKLQLSRDAAVLEFAKLEIASDIPPDAEAIISQANELNSTLVAPPQLNALPSLAADLEEAIRVSLARQKATSFAGDLRAELPAVYREMSWIRGDSRKGREKAEAYPLARFVVDLKTLVSSEFNIERPRRFKLETAVIENARNSRKSIFIPANLQQGWGEGTFFQAIVLLAGT